jgi:deoxyribonuclease-4
MFNKSNNQWRAKKLETPEVDKFFAAQEETGVGVACSHAGYLINLASPDPALNQKSYDSFKEEMERCNLLKITNLVIHPGSHVGSGEEVGLNTIAANLNKVLTELKGNIVTICLETTAGQGSNLGYTFEQIAYLIEKTEDKAHIGVCMDSCHVFAAGYGLADPADYKKTMKSFDDIVGLDKLRVLHLNDSKKGFGSKVDRHEHIGKGEIGLEGFRNIVNDKRLVKVPMVIETPKEEDELATDAQNLKILRGLVKK